jgi:hypothetical protein
MGVLESHATHEMGNLVERTERSRPIGDREAGVIAGDKRAGNDQQKSRAGSEDSKSMKCAVVR